MDDFSYKKIIEPKYGKLSKEVYLETPCVFDQENLDEWRTDYNYKVQNLLTNYWINRRVFSDLMKVKENEEIIKTSDYDIPVKIYSPSIKGPFPILLFYHGGAFIMNNPNIYDLVHRYLAYFGNMVVIAPDYRLAPENKFPLGLNDCYESLQWAKDNMEKLIGNNKISVCGDSAGGAFATVVSMMARDLNGPKLENQILIYPCVYMGPRKNKTKSEELYGKGYELDYDDVMGINSYYLNNEEEWRNPYVSPILGKTEDLPPTHFISGECDTLLDQGLMYATKLKESGVNVKYHIYEGMPHAFINRPYQKTFEALDEICNIICK